MRFFRSSLAACLLLWAQAASAGDPALAETLFQEAKKLANDGKFEQACPKFEASYKADRTLGTLLNLADCHEQTGRIATAWATWNEGIEISRKLNDDRIVFATERRDKLTPRLPKLELEIVRTDALANRGGDSGLQLFRGDVPIPAAAYGTALPVDPGKHELTVRRGGKVLEKQTVTAEESRTLKVRFDFDAIDKAHPPPKDEPARRGRIEEPSSQRTIGFIVGAIGVAGLATAGVIELVAINHKNKADEPDQCVNKYCGPDGLDRADKAESWAEIGQWVGLGGLVVTLVGATLILTAPAAPEPEQAGLKLSPWVGRGGGGLALGGSL
jgi:tetratricopeptide (TPR) repeat protein